MKNWTCNKVRECGDELIRPVNRHLKVGNIHVPNVAFGAINEVNSDLCESLFKKPADGEMGLMLVNETGREITKIPSPMFGFIANAEKPLITIYQQPYLC